LTNASIWFTAAPASPRASEAPAARSLAFSDAAAPRAMPFTRAASPFSACDGDCTVTVAVRTPSAPSSSVTRTVTV
jgi:hypothetical protein